MIEELRDDLRVRFGRISAASERLSGDGHAFRIRVEQVITGVVDDRSNRPGIANADDARELPTIAEPAYQRPFEAKRFDQCDHVVGQHFVRDRAAGMSCLARPAHVRSNHAKVLGQRGQMRAVRSGVPFPDGVGRNHPVVEC